MASKVQMEKFNKKVEKLVLELGGVEQNRHSGKLWELQTKAGLLSVSVHEPEASKVFSIFCRFENPKLANEILTDYNKSNLNPHSGKWNYHTLKEEDCLESFRSSLKEIEESGEIKGLYDLRVRFGTGLSMYDAAMTAIRDCFNRHKGQLNKKTMDETIDAISKNTPEYKKAWVNFQKTFEVNCKDGKYINPFYFE